MIYIDQPFSSFFLARRKDSREKEGRRKGGRTFFETRLLFSFFLYIRREQTIEDTNSLEKQRVCLGEICSFHLSLSLEEVLIAEDDSFGGGGEIFSINGSSLIPPPGSKSTVDEIVPLNKQVQNVKFVSFTQERDDYSANKARKR